jgi:Ca-activated chloride channel family protein
MTFENPEILWLLAVFIPFLIISGLWGWNRKKEAAKLFLMDIRKLRNKYIEKYILAGTLVILFCMAWALPQIPYTSFLTPDKSGEVILLVDVSRSMAAQADVDTASRLERVKTILYDFIDEMEQLGDIKIALCCFTDQSTSLAPLVGKDDYSYLKESIEKILDVNCVPGTNTQMGQSILDIFELPSLDLVNQTSDEVSKIIVLVSDGEIYYLGKSGIGYTERVDIDNAISKALQENIKIVTIGVGEEEGAKIPIYNINGTFTGTYEQKDGFDFVSYLEEGILEELASKTGGKYFYEDKLNGLSEFIEENTDTVVSSESSQDVSPYRSIASWFMLASVPVWIVFAKRHLLG